MLYKKNNENTLSDSLFKNPTSEYRGTPFWAWNSFLTKEELCRQIDVFKEMGLGGFHMHVRTGLENKYLDEDFLELVKACVKKAKDEDMLAWLYDEDRWPSGAAGGIVTKDEKYRARCLLFTNQKQGEIWNVVDSRSEGGRSGKGKTIACYDVKLNADGLLTEYKRIDENADAEGEKWFALLEIHQSSSWYNGETYADTLSEEAIKRFVEVTHESYKKTVGSEFDKTVPAIFTDEPQFTRKKTLERSLAEGRTDVTLPWTDSVPKGYMDTYGEDILDYLPELFWEKAGSGVSVHRYRYHDYISELFARSFADTVGKWCRDNKIALTGHMMEEPTLKSQTAALGEAMRSYRGFDIPGIDLLCNRHEFTTAKQAQSAAHQFGREGVLSELYGVTGWDADFRTYRHQGDWQAALGITVRVPHLSWYAMQGEAKRDYPASISYQSAWYKEFSEIENHFARVNTALTRGKPIIRAAVIHPVESYWLHWGPNDKTAAVRNDMDERFQSLTEWLVSGQIDFNFISEALLPSLCDKGSAPLRVGEMEYDAVIVPACETLRKTTLDRLEEFKAAGGRLIFLDSAPAYEDALPSDRGEKLYNISEKVNFSRSAVLGALEDLREVRISYTDGSPSYEFLTQLRQDNNCRWLFIAHTYEPWNKHLYSGRRVFITVKGEYSPLLYNTSNGEISPVGADYINGNTVIKTVIFGYDSVLLKLTPGKSDKKAAFPAETKGERAFVTRPESFSLSEENVLVLDKAEASVDGGDFLPEEEILRLDNICRDVLGLKHRGGHVKQPWAMEKETLTHSVTLKFRFRSEISVLGASLALESADKAKISFNGKEVPNSKTGNFIDIAIDKIKLPEIKQGENELIITYPFGNTFGLENVFITGDFGVRTEGERAVITEMPKELYFGDLTRQGLPFYGGEVRYRFKAKAVNGGLTIRVSDYFGAVIKVKIDGKQAGHIIYPPYELKASALEDGEHEIELILYLHRYNTFGPLHLVNEGDAYHGPDAWRTENENWSYQYVLRRTGILKSPEIFIDKK
ncbi:MAG: hypothetical protein J1E34_02100 [Oscillospiraceae bacterium]|nr:hypothetical protein [Oscillospiraceae bacterium]